MDGCAGSFILYEDTGDGWGWEEGEYCLTHIHYCQESGMVTWEIQKDFRFKIGRFTSVNSFRDGFRCED